MRNIARVLLLIVPWTSNSVSCCLFSLLWFNSSSSWTSCTSTEASTSSCFFSKTAVLTTFMSLKWRIIFAVGFAHLMSIPTFPFTWNVFKSVSNVMLYFIGNKVCGSRKLPHGNLSSFLVMILWRLVTLSLGFTKLPSRKKYKTKLSNRRKLRAYISNKRKGMPS